MLEEDFSHRKDPDYRRLTNLDSTVLNDGGLIKILLFSTRDIDAFEVLYYDYGV